MQGRCGGEGEDLREIRDFEDKLGNRAKRNPENKDRGEIKQNKVKGEE